MCSPQEVRHRFSLRSRRNQRIREGPVRAWGSCTARTGASGPRDLPLALSLFQGPPARALAAGAKLEEESEEGEPIGPESGALPAVGRPQDLRVALGAKIRARCRRDPRICLSGLREGGGFVGKEAAWGMTLSPPQQSEVMRLNDPAETLRV